MANRNFPFVPKSTILVDLERQLRTLFRHAFSELMFDLAYVFANELLLQTSFYYSQAESIK